MKVTTMKKEAWMSEIQEANSSLGREQFTPMLTFDPAHSYVFLDGMYGPMGEIQQKNEAGEVTETIKFPQIYIAELIDGNTDKISINLVAAGRLGNKVKNIENGQWPFVLVNLPELAGEDEKSITPPAELITRAAEKGILLTADEVITSNNRFKGEHQIQLWVGEVPSTAVKNAVKKAFDAFAK